MSKFECDLVADLLPLYIDGKCGQMSKDYVESHIKSCEECRLLYEAMTADINEIKRISSKKKIKLHPVAKMVLIVLGYLVAVIILLIIITFILINGVF